MLSTLFNLPPQKRRIVLLVIIYIGFVSLGLPDTVLGVAWKPMHQELEKPIYFAGFIATLLTICSAISAFFSGAILRRIGTGRLLTICGFMTGGALLGYAVSPAFWCILAFAIPLGFGQGAVDTGMNFYVAKHYTSRDMSWLHCCWGVGASLGPMLMTLILAHAWSWRAGYVMIGTIQILLALVFLATLALWNEPEKNDAGEKTDDNALSGEVHYDLRFWCCPVMFFLYCGIEFSMGLWVLEFLIRHRGFSLELAGFSVAGYWGMLTVGRFLIGCVANRLGNVRQIRLSMILALCGGALLMIPGITVLTLFAVGLIGFAFAPFYPAMMHCAPERFDDATAVTVIGYQGGAGMLGAAIIPAIFGYVASRTTFLLLPYFITAVALTIFLLQFKVDGRKWR